MAAMALRLTFCLLILGLAKGFETSAEHEVSQLKRKAPETEKVIFFKAFLARNTLYGVRSTIVFSDVQHNIGGAYNPTTGVFTAPVTGIYEFKSRVARITGVDAEIALFNQNRQRASTILVRDWACYGISSIMKVKKGDHVYVKVNWSSDNNHLTLRSGYFSQFTGYLVRQL